MAVFPWVRNLIGFYAAGDLVGIEDYPHVTRALDRFLARPAVGRGLSIPDQGVTTMPMRTIVLGLIALTLCIPLVPQSSNSKSR